MSHREDPRNIAIREKHKEVEELKAENKALKERIAELEKKRSHKKAPAKG